MADLKVSEPCFREEEWIPLSILLGGEDEENYSPPEDLPLDADPEPRLRKHPQPLCNDECHMHDGGEYNLPPSLWTLLVQRCAVPGAGF